MTMIPANMPTTQQLWPQVGVAVGSALGGYLQSRMTSTASNNLGYGTPSAIPYRNGAGRKRRRRRRLLTCSDKADIAYLVGQLGQGQLGKAAISALLSRRCG